jgi:hypothetical protein
MNEPPMDLIEEEAMDCNSECSDEGNLSDTSEVTVVSSGSAITCMNDFPSVPEVHRMPELSPSIVVTASPSSSWSSNMSTVLVNSVTPKTAPRPTIDSAMFHRAIAERVPPVPPRIPLQYNTIRSRVRYPMTPVSVPRPHYDTPTVNLQPPRPTNTNNDLNPEAFSRQISRDVSLSVSQSVG